MLVIPQTHDNGQLIFRCTNNIRKHARILANYITRYLRIYCGIYYEWLPIFLRTVILNFESNLNNFI
jgi:hypothetical protein